jgi:hypothetical protein
MLNRPLKRLVFVLMLAAFAVAAYAPTLGASECSEWEFFEECSIRQAECDQSCPGYSTCGTYCAGFTCYPDSNGCLDYWDPGTCTQDYCSGSCSPTNGWCESGMDCCFVDGQSQYCLWPGYCSMQPN